MQTIMCSALWLTILPAIVSAQDQGRIRADQEGFQRLQTRLLTLNANGVPLTNYHLAKAQAWLDFSKEEYSDNDRSGIVESTFGESLKLTEQLEVGVTTPLDLSTPLLEGPVRLETDVWKKVEELKEDKWDCAGHLIARLEVQLVHVEHEFHELGPIHAAPYRQAVQRMIEEIKDVDCRPLRKRPAAPFEGSIPPSKPE